MSAQAYMGLFYACLAWAATFIAFFGWAMMGYLRSSFTVLWPLKVVRLMGSFSATVAFIPIFSMLMSGFVCSPDINPFWAGAGVACFQGAHLVQSVISGVIIILFVALVSLFSLIFYDNSAVSANIVAKAHGREDFALMFLKTLLVLCVETFPSVFPTTALVALIFLGGFVWVCSVTYFMPFFEHRWNRFHMAKATSFCFLGASLALSELYPDTDAAVTVYLGMPLAAVLGVFIADWRAHWVYSKPASLLSTPYEVEYKVRQMIHEAVWGHPTSKLSGSRRGQELASDSSSAAPARGAHARKAAEGVGLASLDDDGLDDSDARMLAAQKLISPRVFAEAHAVFRSGLSHFRASSILHVFLSRFYQLQGNRHMQMSHLLQAERRHPFFDVAFIVFQMRRVADDKTAEGETSLGGISALSRVTFDRFAADGERDAERRWGRVRSLARTPCPLLRNARKLS